MMHSHSEFRENDYSYYKLPSLSNDFSNSGDGENRIHEDLMDRGEDGGLSCSVLLGNMVSHLNYGKAQRLYYRIIPKPKGGYFTFLDCTQISDS
jgi:hypothetical protein